MTKRLIKELKPLKTHKKSSLVNTLARSIPIEKCAIYASKLTKRQQLLKKTFTVITTYKQAKKKTKITVSWTKKFGINCMVSTGVMKHLENLLLCQPTIQPDQTISQKCNYGALKSSHGQRSSTFHKPSLKKCSAVVPTQSKNSSAELPAQKFTSLLHRGQGRSLQRTVASGKQRVMIPSRILRMLLTVKICRTKSRAEYSTPTCTFKM